jgi:hypothetical protein
MMPDGVFHQMNVLVDNKDVCVSMDKPPVEKDRTSVVRVLQLISKSLHFDDKRTAALVRRKRTDANREVYSEWARFAQDKVLFVVCDDVLHGKGDEHNIPMSVDVAHFHDVHVGDHLKMMIYAGIYMRQHFGKQLAQVVIAEAGDLSCIFTSDAESKQYTSAALPKVAMHTLIAVQDLGI